MKSTELNMGKIVLNKRVRAKNKRPGGGEKVGKPSAQDKEKLSKETIVN